MLYVCPIKNAAIFSAVHTDKNAQNQPTFVIKIFKILRDGAFKNLTKYFDYYLNSFECLALDLPSKILFL